MAKRLLSGLAMMMLLLAVSSCGPRAGVDINQLAAESRQMALEGKVDQALARLEPFYTSRNYKDARPLLLGCMLQMEVNADRIEAAQKRFLHGVDTSPEVAPQVAGIIENALFAKGEYQKLIDWCVCLCAYKLGDAALTETANRHVMALSAMGRTGEMARVIGTYLPKLSESAAIGLVNTHFVAAIRDREWDRAESLLNVMDKTVAASPGKQDAKVGFSVDLLLAKGSRHAADAYIRGEMKGLQDSGAARNLRVVGEAEVSANEFAAADSLFEFGLVDDPARPQLREAAAVGWITSQGKRGNPVELIRRLVKLQTKKIPVDMIVNLISMNYTGLIPAGTKDSFDALNQLCETLRGDTKAEMCLRQLDGILLDISYFRQDYEGSVKIIERGLIPSDPTKKAMMLNKVNAHIALKKGDYREAIGYFRKFMDIVQKDDADTYDPIEQIQVSTDMILGLNARRIGDLWGKAGSPAEAGKAYTEARQYYSNALKKFPDPASGEHKKIVKEMSGIPQG